MKVIRSVNHPGDEAECGRCRLRAALNAWGGPAGEVARRRALPLRPRFRWGLIPAAAQAAEHEYGADEPHRSTAPLPGESVAPDRQLALTCPWLAPSLTQEMYRSLGGVASDPHARFRNHGVFQRLHNPHYAQSPRSDVDLARECALFRRVIARQRLRLRSQYDFTFHSQRLFG